MNPPPLPPPPVSALALNELRWSSEEKDRNLPSRTREAVIPPSLLPKIGSSSEDNQSYALNVDHPLCCQDQFDAPLAKSSSNGTQPRRQSSSSLAHLRRKSKCGTSHDSGINLIGGSWHSTLATSDSFQKDQSAVLKRRTREPTCSEDTQYNGRDVQRTYKARSLSHERRRRRRIRNSPSQFLLYNKSTAVGSYLRSLDGDSDVSFHEEHDSEHVDDSCSDDEEYGSQDSPENRFPSPLTSTFQKPIKMKGRSQRFRGDNTVGSEGSTVTSISDILLCAIPASSEKRPLSKRSANFNRSSCSKNRGQETGVGGQLININTLVLIFLVCLGYIFAQMRGDESSVGDAGPQAYRPSTNNAASVNPSGRLDENDEIFHFYKEQINELKIQVKAIRRALQEMAKGELANHFFGGTNPSEQETDTRIVNIQLQGVLSGKSFDIQLSTGKMPYAIWVFLKELKNGVWVLENTEQWMEIIPAKSEDSENHNVGYLSPSDLQQNQHPYESFDILEDSIDTDRSFVVGIRNAEVGEKGPVISIYKERSMCGHYRHEVCFGKVINGINTLNAIADVDEEVLIGQITIVQP
ncbi:hypothetical protein IV203_004123 [Nitzschia inconspicua]|uniref:Uncharacterized protein n=1 Tax=Nitzschia inconspicua TaxID=303405 RepID=A0A9K3L3E3_9STRA|nr:hypothetical protein IV203_004123 [Nitzschia inconspicua]